MGSTRLCYISRWVVLLCDLFALSNFSKLTNFEAIPDPKRLEVSTSQFYLKLFRESQRFQWYHLCRAWWSGLDPFSSTAILVPAQRYFVRILKKLQATNDSNVFGEVFKRQVFGTKRHFQWWIMASSWHYHDIFHDIHLLMSSRLSRFVKIDVLSWPTFGYQGPWCRSAWDFGSR